MNIILSDYIIPEKGTLAIHVDRVVEINVTAEQARRKVDHWLMDQVSSQMGADEPTLVVSEQVVWRVPAHIGFPQVGTIRGIGTIDVDVISGELMDTEGQTAKMIEYLEREVRPNLPPYNSRADMPADFIPNGVPRAKTLIVAEDGQMKPAE
ncbi:MAG: hypothetical protein AAB382_04020 [Chloroflexota bacterium]